MEETYYCTFDDSYLRKYQKNDSQSKEIFHKSNPAAIPFSNPYEEFKNLFDELEKEISLGSKAADNKEDKLK